MRRPALGRIRQATHGGGEILRVDKLDHMVADTLVKLAENLRIQVGAEHADEILALIGPQQFK